MSDTQPETPARRAPAEPRPDLHLEGHRDGPELGHRVLVAGNLALASSMIEQWRPRVVFVDLSAGDLVSVPALIAFQKLAAARDAVPGLRLPRRHPGPRRRQRRRLRPGPPPQPLLRGATSADRARFSLKLKRYSPQRHKGTKKSQKSSNRLVIHFLLCAFCLRGELFFLSSRNGLNPGCHCDGSRVGVADGAASQVAGAAAAGERAAVARAPASAAADAALRASASEWPA